MWVLNYCWVLIYVGVRWTHLQLRAAALNLFCCCQWVTHFYHTCDSDSGRMVSQRMKNWMNTCNMWQRWQHGSTINPNIIVRNMAAMCNICQSSCFVHSQIQMTVLCLTLEMKKMTMPTEIMIHSMILAQIITIWLCFECLHIQVNIAFFQSS